jgi:hypothetical protein
MAFLEHEYTMLNVVKLKFQPCLTLANVYQYFWHRHSETSLTRLPGNLLLPAYHLLPR